MSGNRIIEKLQINFPKMDFCSEFKNKILTVEGLDFVENYIKTLFDNEYKPVLVINIIGVVFKYGEEKTLLYNNLRKIVNMMIEHIGANSVIFICDREMEDYSLTNTQLMNLKLSDKIFYYRIIISKSEYYSTKIVSFFKSNYHLLSNPKTRIIYLDNDITRINEINFKIKELLANYTLINIKPYTSGLLPLFRYLFYNPTYKIEENNIVEENEV